MGLRISVLSSGDRTVGSEISYWFEQQRVVIGRGAGADVRLPHPTISKLHATIEQRGGETFLADNGSTNGTLVNESLLVPDRPKPLRDGDRIEVGCCLLSVRTSVVVVEPSSAERTAELARRLVREILVASASAPDPPLLEVIGGPDLGKRLAIPAAPARLKVGRDPSCQLVLSDDAVSREHMEVVRDLDGVLVHNLDSKNGIRVSEQIVVERRLKNGAEVVLGNTRLRFEDPAEASVRQLTEQPDEKLPPRPVEKPRPAEPAEPGETEERRDRGKPDGAGRLRDKPVPVGAELLIYLLAAVILVLSAAGLVVLLRAG